MTKPVLSAALLAAKLAVAAVATLALLGVSGKLFSTLLPWQACMDPRQCLLWGGYDGSRYVMIGDSAFCSYYVDSPDRTIWGRFTTHSGRRIFPGALSASRSSDIVGEGRIVAASWPAGTTVFVNITPTRFLYSNLPEVKGGNYHYRFRRLLPPERGDGGLKYLKGIANYAAGKSSFFFRNEEALPTFVSGLFRPPVHFRQGDHFNRVWRDDARFARGRYEVFAGSIMPERGVKPFDWTERLHRELSRKGIRTVFVLTPLNRKLVRRYSGPAATRVLGYLDEGYDRFTRFAAARGFHVLDLYAAAGSDDFADLVHTNERGDDLVARAMAAFVSAPL